MIFKLYLIEDVTIAQKSKHYRLSFHLSAPIPKNAILSFMQPESITAHPFARTSEKNAPVSLRN